jgi:general secretion pathway protein G
MTQYSEPTGNTPRNAAALWALLLGIAALVLAPVIVGGLLGIVAAILAIVGLTRPQRKGLAIGGLVTGIVSLPIAFLAVFVWAALLIPMTTGRTERARQAQTEAELSNLKIALEIFETDLGRYPTTAEGLDYLVRNRTGDTLWRGPYIERRPLDPWGHAYIYLCLGVENPTSFDLFSAGPDGVPGTRDDVKLLRP